MKNDLTFTCNAKKIPLIFYFDANESGRKSLDKIRV